MPTEAKQAQVAELVEVLSAVDTAIVSDHRGLTVADLRKIRRQLRERDIEFRVIKNRIARIAAEQAGRAELVPLLDRPERARDRWGRGDRAGQEPARRAPSLPRSRSARRRDQGHHVRRDGRHPTGDAATAGDAPRPARGRDGLAALHDGRAPGRAAARTSATASRSCETGARPPAAEPDQGPAHPATPRHT